MARKINILADAKPVVQKSEKSVEVPYYPTRVPDMEKEEIDYDAIEERENEIDELIIDFICELIGAVSPEDRDMVDYGIQDELEVLKDEFEEVLSGHGITIYRPTVIEDDDGNEVLVDSMYE